MTPEIEEFAKILVEYIRDASIQSNDMSLGPTAVSPVAKRWAKAARYDAPVDFARVLVPDVVDDTVFYLLHAIDEGILRLSYTTSNGTVVDLTEEGLSELAGWGTWEAAAGARCSQKNDSSMIAPTWLATVSRRNAPVDFSRIVGDRTSRSRVKLACLVNRTPGHRKRIVHAFVRICAWLTMGGALAGWPAMCPGQPLVGAYYYPWYGSFRGGHDFRETLRAHLMPQQQPAIGWYDSRQAATIAAHIDHSHRGNISFWAVSWWGPQSAEDVTLRDAILAHPRKGELKYAVHYESPGRLGSIDQPKFDNLVPDFVYLAKHYFNDPSYLRVDGRPVVWIYLTRAYFNGPAARRAVADLRASLQHQFAVNPYLIGDDLFAGPVNLERARLWDAITDFDVYGTAFQSNGSTSAALKRLGDVYDQARAALTGSKVGFVPAATPGFNDKGVRGGHRAAPRYFVDSPDSRPGDVFARMLKDIAVPRTDPKARHMLMINSFNEWHEDTQIEPTAAAPRTSADDSAEQRYTEGYFYEGYGEKYLKILDAATRYRKAHAGAPP